MLRVWLDTLLGRLVGTGVAALVGVMVARGILPPEVGVCLEGVTLEVEGQSAL